MKKVIFIFLICFVLSPIVPSSSNASPIDKDSIRTIHWNATYEGPIYSYSNSTIYDEFGNVNVKDLRIIGYSDGNGTYYLTSFTIQKEIKLVIEKGVSIVFNYTEYDSSCWIYGDLILNSTEKEPILIKSMAPNKSFIHVIEGYDKDVNINYCIFDNIYINLKYRTVMMDNVELRNDSILSISHSTLTSNIKNCKFQGGGAIDIDSQQNFLRNNTILNLSDINIYDTTLVDNCFIGGIKRISFTGERIHINNSVFTNISYFIFSGDIEIFNSTFQNRSNYIKVVLKNTLFKINNCHIFVNISFWGDMDSEIDLRYNYWNTSDKDEIMERIYTKRLRGEYEINIDPIKVDPSSKSSNNKIFEISLFILVTISVIFGMMVFRSKTRK